MATSPVSTAAAGAPPSGDATHFYLELVAHPPGSCRSLWLKVKRVWRRLDNPAAAVERAVQEAFAFPDKFVVTVWFEGEFIVGLVVKSK